MCQCPDAVSVIYNDELLFYGYRKHIGNGIFMDPDDFINLSDDYQKKLITMNFEYCGYHYTDNAVDKLFLFNDERYISEDKIDQICHKCLNEKLNHSIFKM